MNITDSIKDELDGKYKKAIENNLEIQFYNNTYCFYFVDTRFNETCDPQECRSLKGMIARFKKHIDKDHKIIETIVDVDGYFYKIKHSTLTEEIDIIEKAKMKAYKNMKVRILGK